MTFADAFPFIDSIGGFYAREELELLWSEAAWVPDDGAMLEIGCERGRSTSCLLLASKAFLWIVDPFVGDGTVEEDFFNNMRNFQDMYRNMVRFPFRFDLIRQRSQECWVPGPFNLIHIDGSHDYPDVLADCVKFEVKVKPGGVIVFHDFGRPSLPDVERAVEEFLALHPLSWQKVQRVDTVLVIRKKK